MATIQFENGTKVQFDGNPTPKDVEEVATKLNMKSGATPAPAPSAFSPTRQADMAAREKYSAIAAPNTENPSVLGEATKTVANIPTSAWNFAKGALDLINPISIAGRIKEIGSQFGGLSKESGGALPALAATAKELPKTAYEAVIPEAGRGIVSAIHGGFTGNTAKVDEGLKTAQRAVVSDPVGQIAPFLIAGRIGAKGLDTAGVTKGAGAGFDATVSKVAAPVINTVKSATEGVSSFVRGGTKFGVSQATGLKPTTIETITDQPKAVKVAKTSGLDRTSVGQEVQGAIARRAKNLDQTGAAYAPVRESNAPVVVSKGWIENAIKDTTGLNIKKGKITGTGASALRDAGDIRAIQHLYDLWRPVFNRGTMTANEFLNFRQDLAALSKFERQIGKSHPVENAAKNIRKSFNTSFRAQLKGLDKLDARFSKQTAELKELSKGLVDREGNLTDAGLSKIANLSKTKPKMYAQLEELVPGIEKKVRVVQAIEDIQNASGIKVGTYGRAALTGGAFFAGGPIGAVVTAILTSPEAAVPILRGYGLLKNANAVRAVVNALKSTGTQINQLPNNAPVALKKDIKDVPVRMGLSIENVSGGKPSAFGAKPTGSVKLNQAFDMDKLFQKNIFKYKTHDAYMKNKYDGFAKESGLDKIGIKDDAIQWLDNWIKAKPETPTPSVIEQLGKYKPTKPVTLYSGNSINELNLARTKPTSFTTDINVAKEFGSAGRRDNPAIIRIKNVEPSDISVAIENIPKEILKALKHDTSYAASEFEVVSKNLSELSKKYEISISTDGGASWKPQPSAFSPKVSGGAPKTAATSLYTTNEITKTKGIELLTKALGDRKSALEHVRDFWAKKGEPGIFYHATKETSPFVFEKGKTANYDKGLRRGISNVDGLYVGRDVKALHNFYNMAAERGENIMTYKGKPKLLDLTDEKTMQDFVKKFDNGAKIEKELAKRGYDGIKYFDPYSTGEEIVITNTGSLKLDAFNGKPVTLRKGTNFGMK